MECKALSRACMYINTPTCLLACPLTLKLTQHQQKLLGTEAATRQSGGEGGGAAGCGLTASMCWGEATAAETATEDAAAAAEQLKLLLSEEKSARALLEEV
jgi:hypothetical protein